MVEAEVSKHTINSDSSLVNIKMYCCTLKKDISKNKIKYWSVMLTHSKVSTA